MNRSGMQATPQHARAGVRIGVVVATLKACPRKLLDDPEFFRKLLHSAVSASGLQLLHEYIHQFEPCGVTGTAVLAESHIAFHSWPEEGLLFVDIATCSEGDASQVAFARILELVPHESVEHHQLSLGEESKA